MSNLTVKIFTNRNPRKINRPASKITRSKRMLASCGRLVATTSLSLLLHGGIAGTYNKFFTHRQLQSQPSALIDKQPKEPSEKKTEESPETTSKKLSEAERKLHLERFLAQKRAFVQQLLQDIHQDKRSISMSNFMIKSGVLDRNIQSMQSDAEKLIDENEVHGRYKIVLEKAKKHMDKSEKRKEKTDGLHYFSHRRMFRGYLKASSGILDVLMKGTYNCASSTEFITALEDDLIGSDGYGAIILDPPKDPSKGKSGHMLSWYKDKDNLWQIENTDGGKPRRVPFKKGLRVPKEIFIAAYLIRNGIKVSQLPKKLTRFYKRGVGKDGFPIAGESTDLPKPPDHFMPNPYYVPEIEDIIKEAKIIAAMLSLFGKHEEPEPGAMTLSILKIPDGVDWCEVAQKSLGGYKLLSASGRSDRLSGINRGKPQGFLLYATAITLAQFHLKVKNKKFESCTPEYEYEKFKNYVGELLTKHKNDIPIDNLSRFMSNTDRAKKLLRKLYETKSLDSEIRYRAFAWLSVISSPDDLGLFKEGLLGDNDQVIKVFSTLALRKMNKEMVKEVADIFFAAFQKEKDPYVKLAIMAGLAMLGYGMESLEYMDGNLTSANEKRTLTNRIHKLHLAETPSENDFQYLKSLIEKEKDPITKANLIAILAANGKREEALDYAEKMISPLLLGKELQDRKEAEELVLSLGKISSPKIKEMLLSVFDIRPELVLEIGDVFARQNFHSEKIIEQLKKLMDNEDENSWRRTCAALLLILMNEL
ncbi:MAG: hypothetical protein ABIH22_04150 [Candidatus Margulisiibacteriota bacterium]